MVPCRVWAQAEQWRRVKVPGGLIPSRELPIHPFSCHVRKEICSGLSLSFFSLFPQCLLILRRSFQGCMGSSPVPWQDRSEPARFSASEKSAQAARWEDPRLSVLLFRTERIVIKREP